MKAIVLKEFGSVENLIEEEIPVPAINENEVLIQVKAISINPVDVKTRSGRSLAGKLKDENPIILGWDISGVVKESKSERFKTGDEVFGMINFPGHGKAYAEYVAAPAEHITLKPVAISHKDAAAATLVALTAWQALVSNAKVKKGDRVLIHSAAGGVGNYAVQIAKHLGAYVIGTSSAANKDFVLGLGADEHIDYTAGPFEAATSNIDFVLDTIGGDNIDRSLKVIKKGGTIISIPSGPNADVQEKSAALGIKGYPIMVHSSAEDMAHIAELIQSGAIRSYVSKTFNLNQIGEAHLAIETGKTKGKIVILVNTTA